MAFDCFFLGSRATRPETGKYREILLIYRQTCVATPRFGAGIQPCKSGSVQTLSLKRFLSHCAVAVAAVANLELLVLLLQAEGPLCSATAVTDHAHVPARGPSPSM